MPVTDYNGEGLWCRREILARYARYAGEMGIPLRDLSPTVHSEQGRHWLYPVMEKVIEGIVAGDAACVQLGVEFIEENTKFPFGKVLKSKTARALRVASLSDVQQQRIRRRVFGLLQAGHVPHEYREYAKLVRKIGFDIRDVPKVNASDPYVARFRSYCESAARAK